MPVIMGLLTAVASENVKIILSLWLIHSNMKKWIKIYTKCTFSSQWKKGSEEAV